MTRSKERSKLDFKMILIACLARAFRIVVLAWKKLLKASYTFHVLMGHGMRINDDFGFGTL